MSAPNDVTVICTHQEPDGALCRWKITGIPGNGAAYADFALDAAKRRLGEHVLEAHAQSPDEHANVEPTEVDPLQHGVEGLLTEDEREVLRLTGEMAGRLRRVVGGPDGDFDGGGDWAELVFAIHVIQRYVGSQAAARAYPGHFRPLGRKIGGP